MREARLHFVPQLIFTLISLSIQRKTVNKCSQFVKILFVKSKMRGLGMENNRFNVKGHHIKDSTFLVLLGLKAKSLHFSKLIYKKWDEIIWNKKINLNFEKDFFFINEKRERKREIIWSKKATTSQLCSQWTFPFHNLFTFSLFSRNHFITSFSYFFFFYWLSKFY